MTNKSKSKMTVNILKRVCLIIFLLQMVLLTHAQDSLYIGSNPPPLKVLKWLKGEPVSKFRKGKIYVVEFGATWCSPCRLSMPVLSSIANQYRDSVDVISVFIWENGVGASSGQYFKKVEHYVSDMKKEISYKVAVDDPKQTMVNTWMKAFVTTGIPMAFVIGKEGKIIWIGHPIDLDPLMKNLFAGTFQADDAKKQQDGKLYQVIEADIEAGKFQHAILLTDSIIDANPKNSFMIPIKFKILLRSNEIEAYAFAKDQLKVDWIYEVYSEICSTFINQMTIAGFKPKKPDWDLMFTLCNQAIKMTKSINSIAACLDIKAELYAIKGDMKKAAETAGKGILLIEKLPSEEMNKFILDSLKFHYKKYSGAIVSTGVN